MDISKLKNEVIPSTVKDSSQVSKSKDLKTKSENPSILGTKVGGLGESSFEKITWSPEANIFASGIDAVKNSPEVRNERVAELKAAIKNGTYKVDAKAVADKMIDSEIQEKMASRKS